MIPGRLFPKPGLQSVSGQHTRVLLLVVLAGLALVLCAAGCATRAAGKAKILYYLPQYQAPKWEVPGSLAAVVMVEPFGAAPFVSGNQMRFQEHEFEKSAYAYHRWQAEPSEMASYFLMRDLRESRMFQGVFAYSSMARFTHVVSGFVDEFEERAVDGKTGASVKISITLRMPNARNIQDKILLQNQYAQFAPMAAKTPSDFADAVSQCLKSISMQLGKDLYDTIRKSEGSRTDSD